jgi:hypothetical protein
VAAAKAARRVAAGVLAAVTAAPPVAETGDSGAPSPGRPLKATIVLATTNSSAAQATSDPPVPKLAANARLLVITPLHRRSCADALAICSI